MIVVTGGAGFIGSNVVHRLNALGVTDIVVVDDLTDGRKAANLASLAIADYVDRDEFPQWWADGRFGSVTAVIHQGACSSTTEPDGRYVMRVNYEYSRQLLHTCLDASVPLVYASSAAVYGTGSTFVEEPGAETPLNVYGYSKALFDRYAARMGPTGSQVVGLRYFNVYGPRESHKDEMASVVLQLDDQLEASSIARLFGDSPGARAGEQRRDFVHVDDVVSTVLWFLDRPAVSGVFNCGTGTSRTFRELAEQCIGFRREGRIEYVDFPPSLVRRYQYRTEADLTRLRAVGCDVDFRPIEQGIPDYLRWRREVGEVGRGPS